jgi:Smg-4/UPF3 family
MHHGVTHCVVAGRRSNLTWLTQSIACRGNKIRTAYAFVKLRGVNLIPVFKAIMESTPWCGSDGATYRCEVALAIFQKVPRPTKKPDPRAGTYETGARH